MSAFEELGVMPEVIQALAEMSWELPTPVQTEAMPLILGGGDVAVAAETGSGKTGAFCVPILQSVFETRGGGVFVGDVEEDAQGGDAGGKIVLSVLDRGRGVAVDVDKGVAQCRSSGWDGVRGTRGVARGAWYFCARGEDDGLVRVGWALRGGALNLGTDRKGFGYGGTGMKSFKGKFDDYGGRYGVGDVVVAMVWFGVVDGVARVRVSFMKNGVSLGSAFDVPVAEVAGVEVCLLPACAMRNAQVAIDFDSKVPEAEALGFRCLSEATVEDSTVDDDVRAALEAEAEAEEKGDGGDVPATGGEKHSPLALILEPSRELAGQVEEELKKCSKFVEPDAVRHLLLVGGGNPKSEMATLRRGVDIVSGTLGSVIKYVKNGALSLEDVRFFVLDEADTFATDNLKDVLFLHGKVPARNRVQTLLFSATLHSPEIRALSDKIQTFPTWIDLKGKEAVPDTVHHTLVRVDADADAALLEELDAMVKWPLDDVHKAPMGASSAKKAKAKKKRASEGMSEPMEGVVDAADVRSQTMKKLKLAVLKKVIDANNMNHAMLFIRTQRDGDNLESFLLQCSGVSAAAAEKSRFRGRRESGPEVKYSCAVLHGGRRQSEREDALAAFKAGEVRFLVCTDVAARGIDVVGLPYLVNVTLPDKSENYIHRVGRVGRAERLGMAVSLVSDQKEAVWYHTCNKAKNGVCNNRKLVDAGGCVMWYNESKLLAEIEERLKGTIEELGSDFRRKNAAAAPVLYGARVGEEVVGQATAKHIEMLKPAVQELVCMENDAQASFFALQQRYAAST